MATTRIFIDSRVNDHDFLISQFAPGTEYSVLDASRDGIEQIVSALGGGLYDSLQIISHGAPGTLVLGSTVLKSSNLGDYSAELAVLGGALTKSGDLLLYGCDVADGATGISFISSLAELTGADVAASTNVTGSANYGGDWVLEAQIGAVETIPLNVADYQESLGADSQLPSGLVNAPYSWNGIIFSTRYDGAGTSGSADRYTLSGVANGATVSVYMGNSSTIDDQISIQRNGVVLVTNDDGGDGMSGYDAFLSWSYVPGDVVLANVRGTTGSYSLYVSNNIPTLTAFSGAVDTTSEEMVVEITFAELAAKGNESDVDGTVNAFVVKSVSSGNLRVGLNASSATAYNASTNNTIDATHQAYWTPVLNANGTLNAFTAVAKDNSVAESLTAVQATVSVTPVNDAPIIYSSFSSFSSFAAKVDYATVSWPNSVTSADVNGDARPDLIVANRYSDTVSVLMNNGNGTFAAKVDYATGDGPYFVTSADVNGDARPDLIVANLNSSTVSVLLNNGNGTFAAKVDYASGSQPWSVTSADVNVDARPDLVVANYSSNTVSVLLNNGNGMFAAKVDYVTGDGPSFVTSADVNGDARPDLIVANKNSNTVSVLLNNGNGTFAAKVDYSTGSQPWSVTSADVNGDARPDLIVANKNSNTVSVLLNNGNGTFATKVDYATGMSPYSVTSADVNGDARLDLIVANYSSNTVSVLLNNGNGTFAAKVDHVTGSQPWSVTSADVNGDARPDLVVANYSSNTVSVLINAEAISLTEQTPVKVFSDITINDPEGDASWNGGKLKVQITQNAEAADRLNLPTANPGGSGIWLDIAAGNKLMSGTVQIGTADAAYASNGVAWLFNFSANATNDLVQLVARALTFNNGSDVPGVADRSISITVTDNGGASASTVQMVTMDYIPTLTAFSGAVDTTSEDMPLEITFAELAAKGNESDVDGTVNAFVVKSVSSGSLRVGLNTSSATAYNVSTNNTIDATHQAYWTPALNANGMLNAFTVVAKDNGGAESLTAVQATVSVTPVSDAPTVSMVSSGVVITFTEQTPVKVFSDITINDPEGDASWNGGKLKVQITQNAEVADRLNLPTANPAGSGIWLDIAAGNKLMSGSLQIGTADAAYASNGLAWLFIFNSNATNDLVQLVARALTFNNGSDVPGVTDRSISITATDNGGASASTVQTVMVTAVNDLPALTAFSGSVDTTSEDMAVEITFAELAAKGNESDVDGTVNAFVVKSVSSGSLRVGLNTSSATAYNVSTNNTIDATHQAYWTPALNANGTLNAFTAVAKDNSGAESLTAVQATVGVTPMNDAPIIYSSFSSFSSFAAKVDYATVSWPNSVTSADVNGDARPDLIVANRYSDTVSVLMNNGNGTFAAKVDYATGDGPYFVTSADVNGDARSDLIVANLNGSTVSVLLNSGNGTFAAKVDYASGSQPWSLTSADVNVDARPDLVVANYSSNTVSVLLNNGNGMFAAKVDYVTGDGPSFVTSADVNGDARPDLIVANKNSNTVSVLLNNGNGTYAAKVDYVTGSQPWSVTSADVNGDARPDLIVANKNSNTLSVLLNNGNGTFATKVDYATGMSPYSVTSADVNGDSRIDLIVANNNSNTVSVLLNNGNGTFAAKVDHVTGSQPWSVTSADVNGDARPDLVVANYASNTVSVLINAEAIFFTEQTPVKVASNIVINDPDGDASWNGGKLKVQITQNAETADMLNLPAANPGGSGIWLFTAGVNRLMSGIVQIGTADAVSVSNGVAWVINLNANATNALVQDVARAVTFSNSSDMPGTDDRSITITATDNLGASSAVVQMVRVALVNDPPTQSAFSGALKTTTEDTAVEITFSELAAQGNESDVDGIVNAFVVKSVSSGSLSIGLDAASATAYSAYSNNTVDATRRAYWTPALNANGTLNAFTVVAKDNGGAESLTSVQAMVSVTPVNDAPTISRSAWGSSWTLFTEQTPVKVSNDIATNDLDGSIDWNGGKLNIQIIANAEVADNLTLPTVNPGGIGIWLDRAAGNKLMSGTTSIGFANGSSVSNGVAWSFTFSANATNELVQEVVRSVTFSNNSDTPGVGDRSIRFTITDNSGVSASLEQAVWVIGVNELPLLSAFTTSVDTTSEDTPVEITFSELAAQGNESDVDGTVNAFVIRSVSSGSLRIGLDAASATAYSVSSNSTVDATHQAYWIPALNANGTQQAFMAVAKDNSAVESLTAVQATVSVTPVNDAPTVSRVSPGVVTSVTEQTPVKVASNIVINDPDGDASWNGGKLKVQITQNAETADMLNLPTANPGGSGIWLFTAGVNRLMSGIVQIGTADAVSVSNGVAWVINLNANATNALVQDVARAVTFSNSSDMPGTDDRSITITATDNLGASSAVVQMVRVALVNDPPTQSAFSGALKTTSEDTAVEITFSELAAQGNESDVDGIVNAFVVKSVSSGSLSIGLDAASATAYSAYSNNTVDAMRRAYWTPTLNANGTLNAFTVVAKDNGGAESLTSVQAMVSVTPVNDAPTISRSVWGSSWTLFTEQTPVMVSNDIATNDLDGSIDWNGGKLNIQIIANAEVADNLTLPTVNPGGIGIWLDRAAGNKLMSGTTSIGFANGSSVSNGMAWNFTFSANATNELVQEVVRSVTFSNNSDTPGVGDRSIRFTITDNSGVSASLEQAVWVIGVNESPLLSAFTTSVDTTSEDTPVEITFAELAAKGNESDVDGTVNAFVIRSVSSGSLRIGLDAASATAYSASSNNTVDATHQAYWTPALNSNGTQQAFMAVARDNSGAESLTAIQATVGVAGVNDAPMFSQPLPFGSKVDYSTGSSPSSVTSADVNGDGKADLVVSNSASSTVSVLINNGDGTFASRVDCITGTSPSSLVVVDSNGDGRRDLIVANSGSGTVSVLLNNGNGTFATKVDSVTGSTPSFMITADINKDGKADLIVANAGTGSSSISVLTGNGDGTFASKVDYAMDLTPRSISSADVNGDGWADLVVVNGGGSSVSVLSNKGDGTFAAKVDYATGSSPSSVTCADVNGDGKADLIVSNYGSSTVSVLTNKGDGTFVARSDYFTGTNPSSVTTADVNGDGKTDLIVSNTDSGNVSVLTNRGDGTFFERVAYFTGTSPSSVTSADVNGDGKADLIVSNAGSNTVSVLTDIPQSPLTSYIEQTSVSVVSAIVVNDPEGDASWNGGLLKMQITSNAESTDSLSLSTANPGGTGIWLDTSAGNSVMAGVTAIGTASSASVNSGVVWIFSFNANATNALVQKVARAVTYYNSSDRPGTADRSISITATDNLGASVSLLQTVRITAVNDAPILTAFSGVVETTSEDTPVEITLAELKAQGNESDVDGTVTAFIIKGVSSGSLSIGGSVDTATAFTWGTNNTIDATHHAYWSPSSNANGVLPAFTLVAKDNGGAESQAAIQASVHVTAVNDAPTISQPLDLSFAAKVDYATGTGPVSLTGTDIDGDGAVDLVVVNSGGGTVSVLKNNDAFLGKEDYATGATSYSVTSADVNGDGKADLIVANESVYSYGYYVYSYYSYNYGVSVLINLGDGSFGGPAIYATSSTISDSLMGGTAGSSVISADVNGDGKADLIVSNNACNNLSVLINRGDGTFFDTQNYTTGSAPVCVASADLNGDGKKDLLVANFSSNSVSVFLNDVNGLFLSRNDYSTGVNPSSISTADVNGDGKLDLLVANSGSNSVSVLKNNGDGIFADKIDYAVATQPSSVTIADVNRDGMGDLIVANAGNNSVSVMLNQGDGIFGAKEDFSTDTVPRFVTSAELNGDGKLDLIVASSGSGSMSVLTNTSLIALTPFTEQTPVKVSSGLLFNHPDGDASWSGGTLTIQIARNAEAADSLSLATLNPGVNGIWLDIAAGNKLMCGTTHIGMADATSVTNGVAWTLSFNANVNNALVQDVAQAITFNNSSDTPGTADRSISFTVTDNRGVSASIVQIVTVTAVNELPVLTSFSSDVDTTNEDTQVEITFAELKASGNESDVDGTVDAFVIKSVSSGILRIGLDASTATAYNVSSNSTIDTTHRAYWTPVLNANGTLSAFSAVARDSRGGESLMAIQATVSVTGVNDAPMIARADGLSFSAGIQYSTGIHPSSITSADLNGDGNADLIVSDSGSNKVSVLTNEGDGTFAERIDYATGGNPSSVRSDDVNDDGKADLIIANFGSDTVSVLKNNGDGTFAAKVDYVTGTFPSSVTSADVNGDHKADLIVTNNWSNSVSLLRNNGDGTFAAKVDYVTGSDPASVTSADVNGDGKADIILANWGGNTVSVLKNNGDGTFADRVDYATGIAPSLVTSADVNGDGKADLVVVNSGSDTVSVLKNNGDGTFGTKIDYIADQNPQSIVSSDLDGDGHLDLIVTNSDGALVSVLKNRGDGTFAPKVDYATGSSPESVAIADVNGDGKSDLVVANSGSGTVSVFANISQGAFTSFTEQISVQIVSGVIINHPDGDASWSGGSLKLQITANAEAADTLSLAASNPGGSGIWLDRSAGNKLMAGSTVIGTADAASVSNNVAWNLMFNSFATNALVQDVARAVLFNNSSDTPGIANRGISFTVIDNKGVAVSIEQTVTVETVNDSPIMTFFSGAVDATNEDTQVEITVEELKAQGNESDIDGVVDAFVIKKVSSGSLKIGSSAETATVFAWATNNTIDATHHAYWAPEHNETGVLGAFIAVARDNSGAESLTDVQATVSVIGVNDAPIVYPPVELSFASKVDYATGNMRYVVSGTDVNGDGMLATGGDYSTYNGSSSVTSADLNGDGHTDLIITNSGSNTVSVLKNNGDGTFAAKVDYMTGCYPSSATAADVNGDANIDLVVANSYNNTLSVLKNNGDGTFAARVDYITGWYPSSVVSQDVNGDARADLIVTNSDSNTVSVLENNGDGTFAARVDYATGWYPSSVVSADLNADGNADLIVVNKNDNTVSILINNGDGTFASKVDYATGISPASVTIADIDNDGKSDLVVANYGSNTVTVLKNNGNGTFAFSVEYTTGHGAYFITSDDVNGDGNVDLLVLTGSVSSSNTLSILTNNGDGTFASAVDYLTVSYPESLTTADVNGDGKKDLIVTNRGEATVSVLINTSAVVPAPFDEQIPVRIMNGFIVHDPEGDTNWNGGSLKIQITANAAVADRLTLPTVNPGGTGIWLDSAAGNRIMAGATDIGLADANSVSNGTAWRLNFNANATNELVQEVVRAVSFIGSSITSGLADRIITLTATDNSAASFSSAQSLTTTSPVFTSAAVNGGTLVLSYSVLKTLDATNSPMATAFGVSGASSGAHTVSAVAVNAALKTVTLTLATAVTNSETVTVTYTDPTTGNDVKAIQDAAGNDAATITAKPVTNNTPDTTAPVFASASVNGSTLVLNYTELNTLDATNIPAATAFGVSGASSGAHTVSAVAVNAALKTVTLTLATAVTNSETVTVTYTDPTTGNDVKAIQDAAGNDAATITAKPVTISLNALSVLAENTPKLSVSNSVSATATNDAPVGDATDITGAVTDLVTTIGTLTDSAKINFTDVDLADSHSISNVTPSAGALGTLTPTITADTTGTRLGGVVSWNYSVAASSVEYLAEGDHKVESFTFSVLDGYAGSVERTVDVTIPGTSDGQIVDLTGSVTFWKTGAPIAGVTSILTTESASTGTQSVEFRNIQIAADGTRTIEIWKTSAKTDINSLQLELALQTGSIATWQDAADLPAGWNTVANTGLAGQFILGGIGTTVLSAGPVKLGTLTLTAPANPQHFELALTKGELGKDTIASYGIVSDFTETAIDGLYQHFDMLDGSYALTSAKVSGTAENNAIKADDALAALKMAVGINPNADGRSVSSYQFLAADVNKDGQINAADALNILKMAVKLDTAPEKELVFVPESMGSEAMSRTHVVWTDNPIPVTLDVDHDLHLIGIVMGDINGSWVA